jgi:hypothetical protein
MAHFDARGNPCSSSSTAARDAVERALWRMMSFYDTPMADLDEAILHDAAWALPHVMKAGFLLGLTEASLTVQAAAHLDRADALSKAATARERGHLQAVHAVLEGRWQAACAIWDDLLLDHPRDALALQWAQSWDFYRGDANRLRQRPARVLPEWDEADALHPYLLAHYAFGLEECNLYPQAEEMGRRALATRADVPWAMHAVAHVMEMQGRFEAGAAWLRQHQPVWSDNGLAAHLWWHKCLFRIEALDFAGALRLVDVHLSGEALQIDLQRIDAVSMLWRLHLVGEDIADRCHALLRGWNLDPASAGHYSFNDLHIVIAWLCTGEVAQAEAWVARCAERALSADDARRSNHGVSREVGLPLMRGLLAFARGDADGAVDLLYGVRGQAQKLGGSHAQRDLIDQTALTAAAAGNRRGPGRAMLNERRMARAMTPLTRHWIDKLADISQARA